jgi:hypothetical protein
MTSETFVETRKNRLTSWSNTITVTRTPATLSERRMTRARWFDYVGDFVIACFNVAVTVRDNFGREITETFFEIVTETGRGCVTLYQDGEELDVFIPNESGHKALLHGFWMKRGHKVGHAGLYVRANRIDADSRKRVDHTCPARIYQWARGEA